MNKIFILVLLATVSCSGQNTISFATGEKSPNASLNDITWVEGHWKGEAFGGITEEIWSPPLGKSMMFSFKLVSDGKIQFYEFGHIREIDETLLLQLKHFHGDLKGWEEKEETVTFKFVKLEGNRVYFDDFTFEKLSDNEINIYVVVGHDDGTSEEVRFNFKRQ